MKLARKAVKTLIEEGLNALIIRTSRKVYFENFLSEKAHEIPIICKLSWRVYSNVLCLYTSVLHNIYPTQYTDTNPFKIVYVEPHKITEISEIDYQKYSKSIKYGQVIDGDWDKKPSKKHEDLIDLKGLEKYLNGQKNWEGTKLPEEFEEINRKWAETEEERKHSLKNLAEKLENNYLTQKELWETDAQDTIKKCNDTVIPFTNEIKVSIGRNGELLKQNQGGRHRLALAKILDLEKIPVMVMARHTHWQQKRNEIIRNNTKQNTSIHPDFADIFSN